jgi:outer membrane protein
MLSLNVGRIVSSLPILLLTGTMAVRGAETNVSSLALSLSDCIRITLEHNFDVKIARYDVEIRRYDLSGAYGAYEPALGVSGTHFYSASPGGIDEENRPYPGTTTDRDLYRANITTLFPTGLRVNLSSDIDRTTGVNSSGLFENSAGSASIQLRQPLLRDFWIDASRMAIRISKKDLAISELALREQIMNTVTEVELAYYDFLLARERIKVQEDALARAQRLVNESKKRVEAGTMARQDEKQSESQLSARQADLLGAQGALAIQEYALKRLMSDDFSYWQNLAIQATGALIAQTNSWDLQESWQTGLTRRPDLLQLKADLERQGIILKYLNNQRYPQLDIVGSYGQVGAGVRYDDALGGIRRGDSPFYSYGAALSIPLAGNRAARGRFRAGKAELEQSLVRLKQLEQDIMVQIGVAVQSAKTRLAQVDKTRQSRLFAETALEAEQRKLENGRSTSFVILQLQRELTAALLSEITALAEYNKALAQLALRVGITLDRNNFELEVK